MRRPGCVTGGWNAPGSSRSDPAGGVAVSARGRGEESPPSFRPEHDPFLGFEVSATVDGAAFRAGQIVRLTVAAVNNGPHFVVHRYPGWRRFDLTVRDRHHRVVAHSELDRSDEGGFDDRWLPGQMLLFPVYWTQHEGPVVPAWSDEVPGPRVEPGRYRARVAWLGRVPGSRGRLGDVWSSWFEIV